MTHRLDMATALKAGRRPPLGHHVRSLLELRRPFGGYIAALLMRAVMQDDRRLGPPVAQTVNFCGALAKGDFEIAVQVDRGGKATQHWSARLLQGDATVATSTIVCANRRETFAHQTIAMPQVPPPDAVPQAVPPPNLPWVGSYAFRFIEGGTEFGKAPRTDGKLGSARTSLWMSDHPERPLDYVALSSLADCFVLRLVQMRGGLPHEHGLDDHLFPCHGGGDAGAGHSAPAGQSPTASASSRTSMTSRWNSGAATDA